jgi:hypothetical protein
MNKMILIGVAVIFQTSSHGVTAAPSILDSAVNPSNGHTYHLLGSSTWTEAEAAALSLGGHLVTINDSSENAWVFSQWGSNRNLWIGLNDLVTEGTFVWTSGEPVSYTNWRTGTGEPNDGVPWGVPSEDFTYIAAAGYSDLPGQWNDMRDLDVFEVALFGVVELVPEPTVATFLVAVLGGVAWSNRKKNAGQSR